MQEFGPHTRPPLFPDSRWTIEQCGMVKVYGNITVNQQVRREEIGAIDASTTENEFRDRFGDGDYYLELHPLRGEVEGKQKRISGTGIESPNWRAALITKLATQDIGAEVAARRSGSRVNDYQGHGGSPDPRGGPDYAFSPHGGGSGGSPSSGGFSLDQPMMIEIEDGFRVAMPQGLSPDEQMKFIEEARHRHMSEKQREANESLAMRLLLEGRTTGGGGAGGSSAAQESVMMMLQGQLQALNGQLQDAWRRENELRVQFNEKSMQASRIEGELERVRAKNTDLEHQISDLQQKLREAPAASAATGSSGEPPAGMVGVVKTLVGMGPALMSMVQQGATIFRQSTAAPAPAAPMPSVSIPTNAGTNGSPGSGYNQ